MLLLTGRRVAIAVICGIAVVFGLAGWRYFTGESPRPASAKTVPSTPAAAPAPVADTSASLNQLEGAQQMLVDDLQLLQGRVAAQDAEIKRLKEELEALGQRFEALSSFASTAKDNKPAAASDSKSRPASRAK